MRRLIPSIVACVVLCLTVLLNAAIDSSPVADAAQAGDSAGVRALLKQAADVNSAQGDGRTALRWAAMKNDVDLAQTLLYASANVKATTRIGGYTPLILAAQQGHAEVMEPLIKAGADVNAKTSNSTTPLMFAAASGNTKAVKVLLDRGADVNAMESTRGLTAAMFAAASDRAAVIDLLASRGADLKGTTKIVELYSLDRNSFGGILFGNPQPGPPLPGPGAGSAGRSGAAAAAGGPGGGGRQTAAGQNPQEGRNVPGGRGQGKPGIDRQYQLNELVYAQGGLAPIHLAARQGYMDTVRAVIEAGADVNQLTTGDKSTPLLIATINGHFDVAKYLLEHGGDPNLASENGATPLYAVLNVEWAPKSLYPQPRAHLNQTISYLDLVAALLDKGADPNARLRKKVWYSGYSFDLSGVDEIGGTPFWRAAYASDIEAMKRLVAYG